MYLFPRLIIDNDNWFGFKIGIFYLVTHIIIYNRKQQYNNILRISKRLCAGNYTTGDFKYVHNFRNLIKYFLNVQIFGGIIVEKN